MLVIIGMAPLERCIAYGPKKAPFDDAPGGKAWR